MKTNFFHITPSGWAGIFFTLFTILLLPSLAGQLWLSVFISTGCFMLAAGGVAFMYSRLGMLSLAQVGLMGVGGWVMLRLNHAYGLPFEVNLIASGPHHNGVWMGLGVARIADAGALSCACDVDGGGRA